jgi:hypothetical protein
MGSPMKVSAVVVSKMDWPIGPVLDSILPHVEDLVVVRGHGGVFERWEAASRASQEVVYTQDDDAIVDVPAVLAAYEAGLVTCNMPADRRAEYPDGIALVGWGCVFDREWASINHVGSPFDRYDELFDRPECTSTSDPIFRSECDRVFTGLSSLKLIDVPFQRQPSAFGADRMGQRACHGAYMAEIRRRIYAARGRYW